MTGFLTRDPRTWATEKCPFYSCLPSFYALNPGCKAFGQSLSALDESFEVLPNRVLYLKKRLRVLLRTPHANDLLVLIWSNLVRKVSCFGAMTTSASAIRMSGSEIPCERCVLMSTSISRPASTAFGAAGCPLMLSVPAEMTTAGIFSSLSIDVAIPAAKETGIYFRYR